MAFKQNLPIAAAAGFLVVAGIVAMVFLGPTDEERLQEAARRHAATLGPVMDVQMHGTIADIFLETGEVVYAEFAKQGSEWAVSKDLFKDFERRIGDPSVEREMLDRLARRLNKRFRTPSVKFQTQGMRKTYHMGRGPSGLGGQVTISFAYPKVGEVQRGGMYIERFLYAEGRWEFDGQMGSLLDRTPGR